VQAKSATAALLGVFLLSCLQNAQAYTAIINKTDHTEIHIVPAPGKVAIDGDLKDWDLSGAILMFMDEGSKAVYSVRGAMMYDDQCLYIGAFVKDPTPMTNQYSFGGEAGMSWNADAIQLRFVSNPETKSKASLQTGGHMSQEDQQYVNHITLWYSTQDQKAGYFAMYTLGFSDPTLNPPGVEGAYRKDADGQGYTLEYRIPWKVLRAPRPLKGGDTVQVQWQLHWGNKQGMGLRCGMTDVRTPEGSKDLGYMGPRSWGSGILEKQGNIKLAEKTVVGRATGHIPVKFRLEKPAKASLALYDGTGKLVRTCFGAQPHEAGEQTWLWDGLNDYDKPVPPGNYAFRALVHDGIKQKLVCDVGVSGTPPYQTEDGTGGWAGDYGYPSFVCTEGDIVVLGTGGAEAAPTSIGTNLDGRKLWGAFVGHHGPMELHNGSGYFLKTGSATLVKFDAKNGYLLPFSGGKPEVPIAQKKEGEDGEAWKSRSWMFYGMAILGDTIVVSNGFDNQLYLIDLASGQVKKTVPLEKPFGLAADPKGELYAVSGNAVGQYDLRTEKFSPIAQDLDSPRQLAVDAQGNVYVSLQGKTQQVWQISKEGKAGVKFGKPGGRPALGKFDPAGMLNPYDIAVAKNGRLWVAEADGQPKRYSVWNPDGTLWKDFYGSMDYSTSGFVDPERPEHVHAQSVRYLVDYEKGTWQADATILRPRTVEPFEFAGGGGHCGATFVVLKGRNFLWVSSPGGQTLYEKVGDEFVPRMAMSKKPLQTWIDSDNDGQPEDGEMLKDFNFGNFYWGTPIDGHLSLYQHSGVTWHAQGGSKTTAPYSIQRWDCLGFNDKGGLVYADPAKLTTVATDEDGGAVAAYTPDAEGNLYVMVSGGSLQRGQREQGSGHRVVKFGPDGKKLWEYHNAHCAFAWTSDSYTPGQVMGAVTFSRGTTKDLIAVTGYYGQYFLLDKRDGLFVDALGEDQRSPYTLDQHMVLTENFNGTLFQHARNGKTYFIGGDADCRLWELTGLETIQRLSGQVPVSSAQFAQSQDNAKRAAEAEASALGQKVAKLPRLKGAAADGKYDEWGTTPTLTLFTEADRSALAQVGYDDQNLYVRFQVNDDTPLRNNAADYSHLFKSGDAVEIQLGTDLSRRNVQGQNVQEMAVGDLRLIIARTHEDKMVATLYRPRTADPNKPNRVEFKSPTGSQAFDEVIAWNDLPMHCQADKESYVVEAAIPWARLGITPKAGLVLQGDAGVIYGNQGGTRNAVRYLWSDKSPEVGINNDIPSEVRIHPNDWGKWILE
jgi:hypothetical protein